MDWRIKGCIQGLLARAPGGGAVNEALQKFAGGRVDEGAHIDTKFRKDWLFLVDLLRDLDFPLRDQELVEIGTGWLPVLPLCFALAGARRIHTFDLHRHLRYPAVPAALMRLQAHLAALAQACGLSEGEVRERHAWLCAAGDGRAILERAGVVYRAPADAAATGLADDSVALVFSNSVLEHVPADVLAAMMRESERILQGEGLALHSVNCGDHYAYFDRSITPIHYLRYSAHQWKRWNNDILFQNRLRPSDFIAAAEREGLAVVHRIQTVRKELLLRLHTLPIAPEFRHYPAEELCTTSVTFAARPSARGAGGKPQG